MLLISFGIFEKNRLQGHVQSRTRDFRKLIYFSTFATLSRFEVISMECSNDNNFRNLMAPCIQNNHHNLLPAFAVTFAPKNIRKHRVFYVRQ